MEQIIEIFKLVVNYSSWIAFLIVFLGVFLIFNKKIINWDEEKIKNIAVSLGMFFTFIGIYIGLYNFDTNTIDESIPELLEGLKIAFITSIAGIFVSIVASTKEKYINSENTDSTENNQKEILEELKNLNKNISGGEEGSLNNLLKSIDKNIGGEGSYSLVGQVKELKEDNSTKLQEIKNSFEEFAKKMAENNMDALTEAIEKVMGEFNTTINEKLGETFDNFRKSVENLNEWQKNYREQIEKQTENLISQDSNLRESRMAVEKVAENIESITNDYQKISDINDKFDEVVKKLNSQLEGSIEFSKTMTELRENLEGVGEALQKEVKEMTYGSANKMEETMQQTLSDFGSKLASISGRLADDFEKVQRALEIKND